MLTNIGIVEFVELLAKFRILLTFLSLVVIELTVGIMDSHQRLLFCRRLLTVRLFVFCLCVV